MKKIILFLTFLFGYAVNAQFNSGKEFVEFCKLSSENQKASLKVNGWKNVGSANGGSKPHAAFKISQANYYQLESGAGTYALSIKIGSLPAGKMKEIKLLLPNEHGLILSDWMQELYRSGYRFSQINSYTMAAMDKSYTLIIKMIPSDGYSSPISEISYMAH